MLFNFNLFTGDNVGKVETLWGLTPMIKCCKILKMSMQFIGFLYKNVVTSNVILFFIMYQKILHNSYR